MEPRQLCCRWWELHYSKYDWITDSGIPWNLNDSPMKPLVLSELGHKNDIYYLSAALKVNMLHITLISLS